MNGSQHKRMGIAAGIGVLTYSILVGSPIAMALCSVAIPAGAMLPDIDHSGTKIGKLRKNITDIIKVCLGIGLLGILVLSYMSGGIMNLLQNLFYFCAMAFLIWLVERNSFIRDQLGFITKHRGIMHTLAPPVYIIGSTFWTGSIYYDYIAFGIGIGYVIHLLGDMATYEGVPLLWPLSKSMNIKYFSFLSNEDKNKLEIVCNIWCVIFILIGFYPVITKLYPILKGVITAWI